MSEWEKIQKCREFITDKLALETQPAAGLILGSGLGAFADTLTDARHVDYGDIPHFSASTVAGHAGRLVYGRKNGLDLLVMQGRVHYYEGHTLADVVRPIRVLGALKTPKVIITNAAGSVRPDVKPGQIICIRDHLNLLGDNPLVGPNDDRLGTRFPDMSAAYDPELRQTAKAVAESQGWPMREGVYACMIGPSYETPAEIAMIGRLGGDLVGMSTVPEVIAARHMGIRILGLSCVTNMAAGLSAGPLSHAEVAETAERVKKQFLALLDGLMDRLAATPQ
jgi:purine-nucleoside phosphorylase